MRYRRNGGDGQKMDNDLTNLVFSGDGRWSDWQAWEPCSVSCGYGVQVRTRYCNNPPPKDGGKMCGGDLMESTPCEAKPCRKWIDKMFSVSRLILL